MENKLVSILTPCYNGESYIERFLESVLAQTYSNIELIIIDDGSEDRTSEIINSYKERFTLAGYSLIYKYQENAGQAVALNMALKIFSGEYLAWCDSDDFFESESIELRVKYLEEFKHYGFVRSDAKFFSEKDLSTHIKLASDNVQNRNRTDLFEALILEKDSYVCNGTYLVRTSAFLDVNPEREIILSSAGQNWQILIPLAQKYQCGYIDMPLFSIVEREDSHSRGISGYMRWLDRWNSLEDLLLRIINSLDVDKDYYTEMICEKYRHWRFHTASEFAQRCDLEKYYKQIKHKTVEERILYITRFSIFARKVLLRICRLVRL